MVAASVGLAAVVGRSRPPAGLPPSGRSAATRGRRAARRRATATPRRAARQGPGEPPPRPLRRCFPEQPRWVDAPVAALLDRAAEMFDGADYEGALACAEEAARQAPRSVEAHHNRAVALLHLDRLDDARDALALALALAPDDPETLEAAADLQHQPARRRRPIARQIGLEYARRGSRHVSRRDAERVARLALLEGQALDRSRALRSRRCAASTPRSRSPPKLLAAQYERGVALFELCRFAEARRMFERVLAETPDHAHALYHLGLIEERIGDESAAARHLAEATARDPKAFPPPPAISAERVRGARAPRRRRACRPTSGAISPASRSRRPSCPRWTT